MWQSSSRIFGKIHHQTWEKEHCFWPAQYKDYTYDFLEYWTIKWRLFHTRNIQHPTSLTLLPSFPYGPLHCPRLIYNDCYDACLLLATYAPRTIWTVWGCSRIIYIPRLLVYFWDLSRKLTFPLHTIHLLPINICPHCISRFEKIPLFHFIIFLWSWNPSCSCAYQINLFAW